MQSLIFLTINEIFRYVWIRNIYYHYLIIVYIFLLYLFYIIQMLIFFHVFNLFINVFFFCVTQMVDKFCPATFVNWAPLFLTTYILCGLEYCNNLPLIAYKIFFLKHGRFSYCEISVCGATSAFKHIHLKNLYFHFLSNRMRYDRGDGFPFDFEPNRIPFGSKSKEKLSPRSDPIQFERR